MKLKIVKNLRVQKKGNSFEDYEDALSVNDDSSIIAISDGATEASFSKEWANVLVDYAVENPPTSAILDFDWIQTACGMMENIVDIDRLPWYAQNKYLEQGSYATLLILIIDKEKRNFSVLSMGDTCLFWQHGNDKELNPFPIRHFEEFNNSPYLLSSILRNNELLLEKQRSNVFELPEGKSRFFLMTDSLAQWVLKESTKPIKSNKNSPLKFLASIKGEEQFRAIMYDKFKSGELRNDDLTLVILDVFNGVEKI